MLHLWKDMCLYISQMSHFNQSVGFERKIEQKIFVIFQKYSEKLH